MRSLLTLAVVIAALVAASAAAASGPIYSLQGGSGVLFGANRYVPVGDSAGISTDLLAISTKDGTVGRQLDLTGAWGLPATPAGTEGLSRDGRTLVLASLQSGFSSPSSFLVVSRPKMRVVNQIVLHGYFAYDALSPDASTMYLVQYTRGARNDLAHYVVRAYDLKTGRLLPGRVADRTQKSWVMQGYPVTRTWSPDGRWAYTLYQNPGGYPFIHALDTVRGVAHCVGLPLKNQSGIYNIVLSLHGRTLAVHWRSGRPFVDVDTASWRVTAARGGGFDWWWSALALIPAALAGGVLLRRARASHGGRLRPVPGI